MLRWVLRTSTSLQYAHGSPVQWPGPERGGGRRRSVRRWPAQLAPGSGRRGPRPRTRPWPRRRCPRTTRRSPPRVLTALPLLKELFVKPSLVPGSSAAGAEQVQVQAVMGRRLAVAHVHLEQRAVPSIALVGRLEPLVQVSPGCTHPSASEQLSGDRAHII